MRRCRAITGSTALALTWSDGTASTVDLAGWIARGSERLSPLRDPPLFARSGLGPYGGEGDLAIRSEPLRMIADHRAPSAAAEVAARQAEVERR